jgi:hypothetical protein
MPVGLGLVIRTFNFNHRLINEISPSWKRKTVIPGQKESYPIDKAVRS